MKIGKLEQQLPFFGPQIRKLTPVGHLKVAMGAFD
jgi:hypothetical protein